MNRRITNFIQQHQITMTFKLQPEKPFAWPEKPNGNVAHGHHFVIVLHVKNRCWLLYYRPRPFDPNITPSIVDVLSDFHAKLMKAQHILPEHRPTSLKANLHGFHQLVKQDAYTQFCELSNHGEQTI